MRQLVKGGAGRLMGASGLATAALLVALMLSGCEFLGFRNWEWHQRLVLEVETPAGLVTGGSVVTVYAGTSPRWLPGEGAGGMGTEVEGEASFVEIMPGRYLFALLGGEAERAFVTFFPEPAPSTFERAERLETMKAARELMRDRYPLLVTFDDIADPMTVKRVDPADLASSFGPGVALKRITLEITDEKVTEGRVEELLKWLEAIGRERATLIPDPPRLQKDAADPDIQYLTPGSFSTELYK